MRLLLMIILCGVLATTSTSCGQINTAWMAIQADTAYNQQNYDKAIDLYKKLLKIQPANAKAQWQLGVAYYSNNNMLGVQRQIIRLKKLGRKDLAQDLEQVMKAGR